MPTTKRQTRRAISIKGLTYQRLQRFCKEHGHSVSGYLEVIITDKMDELDVPEEKVLIPRTAEAHSGTRLF
jgi:hypothetical protein